MVRTIDAIIREVSQEAYLTHRDRSHKGTLLPKRESQTEGVRFVYRVNGKTMEIELYPLDVAGYKFEGGKRTILASKAEVLGSGKVISE